MGLYKNPGLVSSYLMTLATLMSCIIEGLWGYTMPGICLQYGHFDKESGPILCHTLTFLLATYPWNDWLCEWHPSCSYVCPIMKTMQWQGPGTLCKYNVLVRSFYHVTSNKLQQKLSLQISLLQGPNNFQKKIHPNLPWEHLFFTFVSQARWLIGSRETFCCNLL